MLAFELTLACAIAAHVPLLEDLSLDVDLTEEKVYAMDGDRVVREMTTSSGLDTTEDNSTPRGTFHVARRGPSFFNPKYGSGAWWWVGFKGEYLFHSVPFDRNMRVIEEEAQKLGQKASHGCLRLSVEDARWIYENVRTGAEVRIHD